MAAAPALRLAVEAGVVVAAEVEVEAVAPAFSPSKVPDTLLEEHLALLRHAAAQPTADPIEVGGGEVISPYKDRTAWALTTLP